MASHHNLLHHLRRPHTLNSLAQTHAFLIVTNLAGSHSHALLLIHQYISLNSPHLALSTHLSTPHPTPLFHNLTLRCLSRHGHHLSLLSFLSSSRHRPDHFTFPLLIKACTDLRLLKQTHSAVLRFGYAGNLGIETSLINMYAKNGLMQHATNVFDRMPRKDSITWNALISGYSLNGYAKEAFAAFRRMRTDGLMLSGSTFVGLVPMCGTLWLLRSLHCLAEKCGAFGDEALAPTVISVYSGHGDLSGARLLFETLPVRDVVVWNAMVSGYAQSGRQEEAFEVFRLMRCAGDMLDVVTLLSVVSSCGDLSSVSYGESVHAIGIKFGYSDQISVVSVLVSMYAKFGEMDVANCLLESVSPKGLLLWNSMISGCLLNGLLYTCLDTFHHMQLDGVMPDGISMIGAISACATTKDLRSGRSLHAYGLRKGFESNANMMNSLLSFYSDCEQFSAALKLFSVMRERNVVSWNTLISGWAKIGDTDASVMSFNQMRREGVQFDMITMISILPSFYCVQDFSRGMSFHALAIGSGYESDNPLANALISMYANYGDAEAGYQLVVGLQSKSVISWNALLAGCRKRNLPSKVMVLFDRMKKDGQKPNSVTFLNMLPFCESQMIGKSIHAYSIRNFTTWEASLLTSMMSMYARFRNVDSCSQLFDMVDKRSVIAWNTMGSAYLQSNRVQEAVASFVDMLEMEVELDPVSILNMVSACSQLGSVDLAHCVTGLAVRKGLEKNNSVSNSLIDMYARFGVMSIAKDLFDELEGKDSITWSVMINAYGMHGDGEAALSLFSEMRESGIEPDDIAFVSILSACSHAGLVTEARILFNAMSAEHKIAPRVEHYACMVDLFGRAGYLEEAYDLVRRLPFRPPPSLLEALLGACRYHGNAEVGENVGKMLIECDPQRPSSYVVLSNLYASSEKWTDSGRLRLNMEGRGLRKDPGVSCIQIQRQCKGKKSLYRCAQEGAAK